MQSRNAAESQVTDVFQFYQNGLRLKNQRHQTDKEKRGENQDGVDRFFFRNKMHEESGDEKSFQHGDDQRETDVTGVAEVESRNGHGDEGADQQRHEDADINLQMFFDVVRVFVVHKISRADIAPGTGISRPDQRSARTSIRSRRS